MLKFLQLLFLGHIHKWDEPFNKGSITYKGTIIGNYYECRCVKCGNIKVFKTR